MPAKCIALVTSDTRRPHLNPAITQFVNDVLSTDPSLPTNKPLTSNSRSTSETKDLDPRHIKFTVLDLSTQNLALNNDPLVPAALPRTNPTPHYKNTTTQIWSKVVKSYDAFIFVTPQVNCSIPASLKNALDSLFYEWRGKPAGIVSYGSDGGGTAASHLRDVLGGLGMRVVGTAPGLMVRFTDVSVGTVDGVEAERIELDGRDVEGWKAAGIEGMMRNLGMEIVCELDKD